MSWKTPQIVQIIIEKPGSTIKFIADKMNMQHSTVSDRISQMHKWGVVNKKKSGRDVLVSINYQGLKELFDEAFAELYKKN